MTMILGIDPGLSGALALYWPSTGGLTVYDMPTLAAGKGKSSKQVLDHHGLVSILREISEASVGHNGQVPSAFLEQVSAMPGQGVTSMFSFGLTYGALRQALASEGVPTTLVTPVVWKKALKVSAAKDGAVARASDLLPRHADKFRGKRGGLMDGRAEAALIAVYGARQLALGELAA